MRKKYYWFHDVHTSIEDDQFKKICESMAFFFFLRPFLSYCFVCFFAIDFAFFFSTCASTLQNTWDYLELSGLFVIVQLDNVFILPQSITVCFLNALIRSLDQIYFLASD